MEAIGSRVQSHRPSVHPLLQLFELCNAGHSPLAMAFLQLSDCRLLEPLIHRAIPDGVNVTLVLEVHVGEGCPKRLQETSKLRWNNAGSTIAGVHRMMGHLGGHILRPVVVGGWRCLFWAQLGVGLTQNPPRGRYRPCLIRDEKPTIPRPVTVLAPASLRTAAITSDPQLRLLLGPTIGRICGARGREFDRHGSRCADPDGGSALQESTA